MRRQHKYVLIKPSDWGKGCGELLRACVMCDPKFAIVPAVILHGERNAMSSTMLTTVLARPIIMGTPGRSNERNAYILHTSPCTRTHTRTHTDAHTRPTHKTMGLLTLLLRVHTCSDSPRSQERHIQHNVDHSLGQADHHGHIRVVYLSAIHTVYTQVLAHTPIRTQTHAHTRYQHTRPSIIYLQ